MTSIPTILPSPSSLGDGAPVSGDRRLVPAVSPRRSSRHSRRTAPALLCTGSARLRRPRPAMAQRSKAGSALIMFAVQAAETIEHTAATSYARPAWMS
jgi:hypothetical protein